ncbi:sucrase ferredoxin [Leptothoe sp. LEGE 181152]|nr:sucrase ferredoxin [Leptothoe sp. LEGE 181152]
MTAHLTTDCKFCSVVSKENGEDPIGSATHTDSWLVMELPLPWTEERFHSDPLLKPIHDLFHDLFAKGIQVSPMAIAPDRDYSIPERSHVFYYRRPSQRFSQFERQTFVVPTTQITALAKALTYEPENLQQFLTYRQPADTIRDMMICTHGNIDIACARFGQPIYKKLRDNYAASSNGQLRVWRCSHFGGHQFAPTLVDFPTGQVWGHLEEDILETLICRNQSVSELRRFYRGWSGVDRYTQMVEREIWMQRGWEWLQYQRSGQMVDQDPNNTTTDWARVRLEFVAPDGGTGTYEATVETCGSIMTAYNSGEEPTSTKQYRISRLVQVA